MVVTNENFIKNNPIYDTDTVIIVPSYTGQLLFLKYTLQQLKKNNKYVVCSFDRRSESPPEEILNIPDSWMYIHKIYGAEKRLTWLWHMIYPAGMISLHNNIRYVVTVNGDCVFDKPNNIDKLIDLLGNNDIMSASSEPNLIHTCCVLWKRECFLDFVNYIKKKLEVNIPEGYSPEVLLRDFIQKSKYRVKHVTKQPVFPKGHRYEGKIDHYSSYGQDSTFKEIVGYKNLGGEHKQSCLEHLEPVDEKYIDLRNYGEFFSKHEKETLYWYYHTGDRRYLYKYWSEGEDSFFNRRYLPLKYYGSELLIDDSKRKELGPYSERGKWFDRWKYFSYIIKDQEYEEKWKDFIEEKGYDV